MGAFSLIVVINLLNSFVMKLAVLGATGPSGKFFTSQALAARHHVRAIVRNPSKLSDLKHDNLIIKEASIFDARQLQTEFSDVDAVVSCLGASPTLPWKPISLWSESIKAITDAMKASGKRRLVCMTSAGLHIDYEQKAGMIYKFIIKDYVLGTVFVDMIRMEKYLEENSDGLEYTIVRPSELTNVPLMEKDPVIKDHIQWDSSLSLRIPRANVAKVMLEAVTERRWINKTIYVTMPAE